MTLSTFPLQLDEQPFPKFDPSDLGSYQTVLLALTNLGRCMKISLRADVEDYLVKSATDTYNILRVYNGVAEWACSSEGVDLLTVADFILTCKDVMPVMMTQ